MPVKYPLCFLDRKIRQNDLLTYAQKIHNGIAANPTLYPVLDLPIPLTDFQLTIDAYQTALSNAVKGSKNSTALKNNAKTAVTYALRIYAQYIDVAARSTNPNIDQYPLIEANILASGFMVDKNPAPAQQVQGLDIPIVRRAISKEPGKFYLILRNYEASKRGKRMYSLMMRTAAIAAVPPATAVPAGPWVSTPFTSSNMTQQGLVSGKIYDWQVALIGGRNVKLNQQKPINYTKIQQIVIT